MFRSKDRTIYGYFSERFIDYLNERICYEERGVYKVKLS